MKFNHLLRGIVLLALIALVFPMGVIRAVAATNVPPADMFQLPWDLGIAWVAIDGIDNGSKRPLTSSHQYTVGGAIDFAPKATMIKGEDTSNYWTTAAADGTVTGMSSCHVVIDHGNGWSTHYYFLANIQVKLGDAVTRNQRLGIIADGVRNKFCLGSQEPNVPHLHFMLRPTLIGATFAGWKVNYNWYYNFTTFTKDGKTVGLYKPLMNTMGTPPTPSPTPTAITPTPTGPYISTSAEPLGIDIGGTALVTVRLNNVPMEGYTSVEITCPYNASLLEVNGITVTDLFGTDPAVAISGPQNGSFIVAIAGSHGNKATTSGTAFTFNAKGLQAGQAPLECTARVSNGNNQLTGIPSIGTMVTVAGIAPTSTPVPTSTPLPIPSNTPTPTSPVDTWLTFTNQTYGFLFKYPPQGTIMSGGNDNFTRIDLPFTQDTNLREKYFEMIVAENANPCQSPLATQSMLETSETVVINGISFLKQTGGDAGAGNIYQWIAYSTIKDNVCVSLDFILHSLNPGNFPVPPPVFDYAAETAVFGQIASTFTWTMPAPTPTPLPDGTLTGKVIASKPVIIDLYDLEDMLIKTVSTNPDGTFTLTAPAGTYTTVASSSGFLNAQASVTLTGGTTLTLTTIHLPAGDIDGSGVIDQFDALTIGMNYNSAQPSVADLNNDGIINVLDLEALAGNYRKTGPVDWQ